MMQTGWKYEIAYLNPKGGLTHLASGYDGVELETLDKELGYYFILYEHSHRVTTYHYNGSELRRVRQPSFMQREIKEWKEAVFN